LYGAIVKPTPHFLGEKRALFTERLRRKRWLEQWPSLGVEPA
jgi:hypothetical protein